MLLYLVIYFAVLDRLIRDIRKVVKDTKKFWWNLPYQVCNLNEDLSAAPNNEAHCWNGQGVGQ